MGDLSSADVQPDLSALGQSTWSHAENEMLNLTVSFLVNEQVRKEGGHRERELKQFSHFFFFLGTTSFGRREVGCPFVMCKFISSCTHTFWLVSGDKFSEQNIMCA